MSMAPVIPAEKKDINIEMKPKFEFEKSDIFVRQVVMMTLWYIFSFGSMFTNKYILSELNGDAGILGETQMLGTAIFGAFKMYIPCALFQRSSHGHHEITHFHFIRNMGILGWLRFSSVVCSLISLKYVPVSFTETVKSSSPVITALFAWIMLGEKQSIHVNLTLIPIVGGLALCTANEISFNMMGFIAALLNIFIDCIQNVFSKKLLSSEQPYSPPELQFYTSAASIIVQLPLWFVYTVSIIAHSTAVLIRCKGTATFQGGAGNREGDYLEQPLLMLLPNEVFEIRDFPKNRIYNTMLDTTTVCLDIKLKFISMDYYMILMLSLNAFLFYTQSLTAYGLMSVISPVTFSVSNTAKRAVLIWVSVLVFGNQVSPLSALGTIIVTSGVFLYQRFKGKQKAWDAKHSTKETLNV